MENGIEAEYRRRLAVAEEALQDWSARTQTLLLSVLAAAAALAYVVYRVVYGVAPVWLLLPVLALAVLLPLWQRARASLLRSMRLAELYGRAVGRVNGTAVQSGHTGDEFHEDGHLYARDLDVLGTNSMFGMLATTRTSVGQRALAELLLHGVNAEKVRARQAAVRELAPSAELRERVAMLGRSTQQQLPAVKLDTWLSGSRGQFEPWMRWVLLAVTASWVLLIAVTLAVHGDLIALQRNVAALLALQGAFCLWLRPRVVEELEAAQKLAGQTEILEDGLRLLRGEVFEAAELRRLQGLVFPGRELPREGEQSFASANDAHLPREERAEEAVTRMRGDNDSEAGLKRLARSLMLVEQRAKEWYYAPAVLLAVGTHAAISMSLWRARYGDAMRRWVAAWAEFEALLAIATYAAEHGENVYPMIEAPGSAVFEAAGLVHPLLTREQAVANDVRLDAQTRFLLISGSNMAGKSTLLRAVGCNVVLAMAGAPVCAVSARMSALRVGASLALTDSLAEGKSKFLAEVERLRDLVALAGEGPGFRVQGSDDRCLFMIDEIFSGTNSADRRAAAEAVLRGLIAGGAVGALSTHDLALAELAELPELHGRNVHMASPDESNPLGFDYVLKDGVNRTTNALAIVRMLGLVDG